MTGKSYFHRGGDTPLLGETIPEHFARIVKQFPDNEAIVSIPQNRRLTYRQLFEENDRIAKGLLALGFGKGDRLGVWSTNNIEWLLLQLATARIGVVLVNINPAYRPRELAYALQRSEVECVVTIPGATRGRRSPIRAHRIRENGRRDSRGRPSRSLPSRDTRLPGLPP